MDRKGDEERFPSSNTIDYEGCSGGSEYAERIDQPGQPSGLVSIKAGECKQPTRPGSLSNDSVSLRVRDCVAGYCVDTYNGKNAGPLLNGLQSRPHGGASSEVKSPGISASPEQIDVAVPFVSRIFHDRVELIDFCTEVWIIFRYVTTKFSQDLDGFCTAAVGNEPSGILSISACGCTSGQHEPW